MHRRLEEWMREHRMGRPMSPLNPIPRAHSLQPSADSASESFLSFQLQGRVLREEEAQAVLQSQWRARVVQERHRRRGLGGGAPPIPYTASVAQHLTSCLSPFLTELQLIPLIALLRILQRHSGEGDGGASTLRGVSNSSCPSPPSASTRRRCGASTPSPSHSMHTTKVTSNPQPSPSPHHRPSRFS